MVVSRSPVRLSMGGGGTDLASYYEKYGGFLMAGAINKYVYICINKRFDESIRLAYSKTEIVDNVGKIEHNIFREALRLTGVNKQVEIASIADISSKCGLGTSSTFTVALLNGLYAYRKEYKGLKDLAEAACHLEIDILKEPIGKQDQYASAFGGFNAYTFDRGGDVTVEPVGIREENLKELENNTFLFYLKQERSAGDIIGIQDSKAREGDRGTIERLHKIKELGLRTRKVFEGGNNIDEFGELLHEHWLVKKGLSDKVSDPFIDEIYAFARKNGALGGKVVGAGGGGFLLLYCPKDKSKLFEAMGKVGLSPMWFTFEREGAKIIFHG